MSDMQSPAENKPLSAKLFSIEMLILYAGTIFAFGVGYSSLASEVATNTASIIIVKANQKEDAVVQAEINLTVGIIQAKQTAMGKNINRRMTRQDRRIDKIIDLLEARRSAGSGH